MKYLFWFIMFMLFLFPGTFCQTLVKEINSDTSSAFGHNPDFVFWNGYVYFSADDGIHGQELWRSNGTESATTMVKDIDSTPSDGANPGSNPYNMIVFQDLVYFQTSNFDVNALWKTNGTEKGTTCVKKWYISRQDAKRNRIHSGKKHGRGSHKNIAVAGSKLYFIVENKELWTTDGKNANKVTTHDMIGSEFVEMDGILYYVASSSSTGTELWRSDGTEEETYCLKDIASGTNSSDPSNLTVLDGVLYFTVDNNPDFGNMELWRTRGSSVTTEMVKDIDGSTTSSSSPDELTIVGKTLFFRANDGTNGSELWRSNGTSETTVLVKDVYPGETGGTPTSLTAVGNTLFFVAEHPAYGLELWKSDGTAQGTSLVKDICDGSMGSNPDYLVASNGLLFFNASDGTLGKELWKSNGTAQGTIMVKDIGYGSIQGDPRYLFDGNGTIYFTANDNGFREGLKGRELWKSKGTAADTLCVADIKKYSSDSFPDTVQFTTVGATMYFVATNGTGYKLYKSTGTSAGTKKTDLTHTEFNVIQGTSASLYYTTDQEMSIGNDALFKSNGTQAGTFAIQDASKENVRASELYPSGANLYFTNLQSSNEKMFVTAGTTVSTQKVNGPANPTNDFINEFSKDNAALVSSTLYFTGKENGTDNSKLWKMTSTYNAARVFKTDGTSQMENASYLTAVGSKLYFIALAGAQDRLWSLNTAGQAFIVSEVCEPTTILCGAGSYVYFTVEDEGTQLWKSNGATTEKVVDTSDNLMLLHASGKKALAAGSVLYFRVAAENGTLWSTNGTKAGTKAIKDSYGRVFSGVSLFQGVGSILYFGYDDGVYGYELWQTDGTAAKTKMVKDLNPIGSTGFYGTWGVSSKLYFVADDHIVGKELWSK